MAVDPRLKDQSEKESRFFVRLRSNHHSPHADALVPGLKPAGILPFGGFVAEVAPWGLASGAFGSVEPPAPLASAFWCQA